MIKGFKHENIKHILNALSRCHMGTGLEKQKWRLVSHGRLLHWCRWESLGLGHEGSHGDGQSGDKIEMGSLSCDGRMCWWVG